MASLDFIDCFENRKMSCHGCARGFGFLNKEYGCNKCGFAFCSKCLVNKMTCKNCSLHTTPVTPMAPVMLQEKLEKLENPNTNPVIVYTENPKMADLKRGLSVEDQELVKRLSKLKNEIREMKSVPSEMEIEERLAKLKGIDPEVYRKPVVFVKPNTGGVDEVTHLLNQVRDEVSIDTHMDLDPSSTPAQLSDQDQDEVELLLQKEALVIQAEAKLALEGLAKDKEIQERLRKLKIGREAGNPLPVKEGQDCAEVDSDDEEKQASLVVERALAENQLELDEDEGISGDGANEELPWCELCNEDAQLRCLGCDRDLYCRRCWKEVHKDSDMKRHHIEDYKAPK